MLLPDKVTTVYVRDAIDVIAKVQVTTATVQSYENAYQHFHSEGHGYDNYRRLYDDAKQSYGCPPKDVNHPRMSYDDSQEVITKSTNNTTSKEKVLLKMEIVATRTVVTAAILPNLNSYSTTFRVIDEARAWSI